MAWLREIGLVFVEIIVKSDDEFDRFVEPAESWRFHGVKNPHVTEVDGERHKGEVAMMVKDYKAKLETEDHVPVPK